VKTSTFSGEQLAQVRNPDPFAVPVWRSPVYRTPRLDRRRRPAGPPGLAAGVHDSSRRPLDPRNVNRSWYAVRS
jgi:hypothetical protein